MNLAEFHFIRPYWLLALIPQLVILGLMLSTVGRNKPVRAVARTGVSGKHRLNSPETPPRATRWDGLIPAYNDLLSPAMGTALSKVRLS